MNELDDEMDYAKLVSQLESIAADPPGALLNNEPVDVITDITVHFTLSQ